MIAVESGSRFGGVNDANGWRSAKKAVTDARCSLEADFGIIFLGSILACLSHGDTCASCESRAAAVVPPHQCVVISPVFVTYVFTPMMHATRPHTHFRVVLLPPLLATATFFQSDKIPSPQELKESIALLQKKVESSRIGTKQ